MIHRCSLRRQTAGEVKKDVTSTLHALRTRDITLRVPSKDRLTRVVFCGSASILRDTIERHELIRSTGAHAPFLGLVGTHITFTNLLASLQSGEERVESRFTGDEATVHTGALALGECRAYVTPTHNAELLETAGVQPFPLRVDRVLYNQRQAFSTTVNAQYAELVSCSCSKDVGEREEGRRRAESYLQAGGTLAQALQEADGGSDMASSSLPPPPFSLELQHVDSESLVAFYSYNVSLHGYNYFRRSDGCVAAVGLCSAVDAAMLSAVPPLSEEGDVPSKANRKKAVRAAVPFSYGFLVQPLAAGNAVDWSIWKLQRSLAAALAAGTEGPLKALHERACSDCTTCQDTLSLLTGDYEGAHEATVVARQYTQDPGQVAAVVEPLRAQLGIANVRIALDGKEACRTGLDFFCRCTAADALSRLVAAPDDVVQSMEAASTFKCMFCGRVHHAPAAEWERLHQIRAAHRNTSHS